MLNQLFNSGVNSLLTKAMDASSLREQVIANNIANVDTPDFKRSEVIFSQKLNTVLSKEGNNSRLYTTDKRHISGKEAMNLSMLEPDIRVDHTTTFRNDGNNVDIDVEMAKKASNEIYYNTMASSMSNEIRLLRLAITGRG